MTEYSGACQDLGFLCDWYAGADSREHVVSALVDHLNQTHGTGSTSPALSRLIDRHVTEVPASAAGARTHL